MAEYTEAELSEMLARADHYRYDAEDQPIIHVVTDKFCFHFDLLASGKMFIFLPHQCSQWDIVHADVVDVDEENHPVTRAITRDEALATMDAFIAEATSIRETIALLPPTAELHVNDTKKE